MARKKAGSIATGAAVQELVVARGSPSRSQRRLERLLDGDVFRGPDAKADARERRRELRAAGHHLRYTRANLGGEILFVVQDLGPREA